MIARLAISLVLLGAAELATAQSSPAPAEVALVEIVLAEAHPPALSTLVGEGNSVTSFREVGAFMVVDAIVDGAPGRYVLDSGAPGLIVNRRPVSSDAVVLGEGLNGSVAVAKTKVRSLSWGPVAQSDLVAYAVDLDYLTDALGERIDGMIGYDQLRVAPVTIDYARKTITHHVGDPPHGDGVRLAMRVRDHVAAVKGRIDGRRVRLALDTGAGVNVLDDDRLDRLSANAHERIDDMLLRGLDAEQVRVPRTRVHLTEIADANWIGLPFAFADLSGFAKAGLRVDGVLGKEWLQRHVVTLDYDRGFVWVE